MGQRGRLCCQSSGSRCSAVHWLLMKWFSSLSSAVLVRQALWRCSPSILDPLGFISNNCSSFEIRYQKMFNFLLLLFSLGAGYFGWIDPRFNCNHNRNRLNLPEILSSTLSGKARAFLYCIVLNFAGFTLAEGNPSSKAGFKPTHLPATSSQVKSSLICH